MSFKGFVKYPVVLTNWLNQGSSTLTTLGNIINIYSPGVVGANISGRYVAPPSTPYTVIAHLNYNPMDTTGYVICGGLGMSDGTKIITFMIRYQANAYTAAWTVSYCATTTSINADLAGDGGRTYGFPSAKIQWLALRNDGTNIYFYVGDESGQNFYQVYSEAKGAHLGTINEVGIYTVGQNLVSGTNAANVTCDSFQVIGV